MMADQYDTSLISLWQSCARFTPDDEWMCDSIELDNKTPTFRDKVRSARAFYIMDHLVAVALIVFLFFMWFKPSLGNAPWSTVAISFSAGHIIFLFIAACCAWHAYYEYANTDYTPLAAAFFGWVAFCLAVFVPPMILALMFHKGLSD